MLKIIQTTKQFSRKFNNVYLNKQILNTWNNRYSSSFLGSLLLNKPDDGFSKYGRGGKSSDAKKDGATTESTDSNKNNTKNTNTSNNFKSEQKTGGSGGGKKPNGNGFNNYLGPYWWLIPASALVLVTILSDMREGREISWQDFQTQLLEGGHVDRIIVTNKNIARFYYYCSYSNVSINLS